MKGRKMFSQNLQKIRSEKNLSQEQLADKIGVSRQTISAWESGKASPELDKITAISKLFSVSIDELVGEIKTEASNFDKKEYEKNYSKIALLRASGIFILFSGIAFGAFFFEKGVIAGVGLMISLAISVPLFILAKNTDELANNKLIKSKKSLENVFADSEIEFAAKNKILGSILLVSLLFIAIAIHQIIVYLTNFGENLANAIFMLLLGIAVASATYANSIFAKIQNFEDNKAENIKTNEKIGFFAAILMLSLTAIFLIYSFISKDWSSAEILFPIGGIAIGIYAIFVKKFQK
jgi:hypothetical protein